MSCGVVRSLEQRREERVVERPRNEGDAYLGVLCSGGKCRNTEAQGQCGRAEMTGFGYLARLAAGQPIYGRDISLLKASSLVVSP